MGVVRRSSIADPLEHLFQRLGKHPRDPKGHFQAGGVFALFDGRDGLPCNANLIAQIALRHLSIQKTQRFDIVAKGYLRHGSKAFSQAQNFNADPGKFGEHKKQHEHVQNRQKPKAKPARDQNCQNATAQ